MDGARGWTLIELLVVVVILTIVTGYGVPAFRTMIQDNRLTAEVNRFVTVLTLARSEALKRGWTVTLCQSPDGELCAAPGDRTTDWTTPWLMFEDRNGNGELDAGETVIQVGGTPPAGVTVQSTTPFRGYLGYIPNGLPAAASGGLGAGSFHFCDTRGDKHARRLVRSASGRIRIEHGSDKCS